LSELTPHKLHQKISGDRDKCVTALGGRESRLTNYKPEQNIEMGEEHKDMRLMSNKTMEEKV